MTDNPAPAQPLTPEEEAEYRAILGPSTDSAFSMSRRLLATLDAARAEMADHRTRCHNYNPDSVIEYITRQYDELAARSRPDALREAALRDLYEHLFGAAILVIQNNYAPDPSLTYDVQRWRELVASVNAIREARAALASAPAPEDRDVP